MWVVGKSVWTKKSKHKNMRKIPYDGLGTNGCNTLEPWLEPASIKRKSRDNSL